VKEVAVAVEPPPPPSLIIMNSYPPPPLQPIAEPCFAHLRGDCTRGDSCRFEHATGANDTGVNGQGLKRQLDAISSTAVPCMRGETGRGRGGYIAHRRGEGARGGSCHFSHDSSGSNNNNDSHKTSNFDPSWHRYESSDSDEKEESGGLGSTTGNGRMVATHNGHGISIGVSPSSLSSTGTSAASSVSSAVKRVRAEDSHGSQHVIDTICGVQSQSHFHPDPDPDPHLHPDPDPHLHPKQYMFERHSTNNDSTNNDLSIFNLFCGFPN
jgi:hypothetical protein